VPKDGIGSLSYEQSSNRINTAGFAYDPAGNQLQNGTGRSFVYDAAGRLVKVKDQSGAVVTTYTYGASNKRLITQSGNETSTDKTYYIWEGNAVIAEYVEQTSAMMPKWSKNYLYLDGRLLATEAPNGTGERVQYHHPDRLSTRLVTNNLDTTSFTQASLPFGTANDPESTGSTNQRFTSYDRNLNTGLDYAVNRHYDPRQGRFTQPDPLGMGAASLADPQSLNMYSYVGNDPVNRVDPDGQFWGALFRLIIGLFRSAKPNVINGSFTYRNVPPISVSFTPNFQNIGVGFAGIGFDLRTNGNWLPAILGAGEISTAMQKPTQVGGKQATFGPAAVFNSSTLDTCVDKLFKVSGIYAGNRSGGYFLVSIVAKLFEVDFNTSLYNRSTMRAYLGKKDPRRRNVNALGFSEPGMWTVFIASDFAKDSSVLDVVVTAVFVHELGNKLAEQFIGPRSLWPKAKSQWLRQFDSDAGMALEECVFGGGVSSNSGRVTTNP
jgi:RHS repeat-associated protein